MGKAAAIMNEFVLSRIDHVTNEMLRYELIAKIIPALKEEAVVEKSRRNMITSMA